MRTPAFVLALLIGAAVRMAVLPAIGPLAPRMAVAAAAGTAESVPSPAAAYELDAIARLARLTGAAPALAIRLAGLLATALLTALLYLITLQRTSSADLARWAALACWLNPALILLTDVLGHVDALTILPALVALMLAHAGAPLSAGALAAVATLTDPLGAVTLPAVALASRSVQGWTAVLRATAGALVAGVALGVPMLHAGAPAGLWAPFAGLVVVHGALPQDAASVWWIASRVPALPVPERLRLLARIDPRPWVGGLAALAGALVFRTVRTSRSLAVHAAAAAYLALAAVVLLAGGRAHHLGLPVALLALAAALRPALRPLFYTLSALAAALLALSLTVVAARRLALPGPVSWIDVRSVLVFLVAVVFALVPSVLSDEVLAERSAHYTPFEGHT